MALLLFGDFIFPVKSTGAIYLVLKNIDLELDSHVIIIKCTSKTVRLSDHQYRINHLKNL